MTRITWQRIVERDLAFVLLSSFLLRLVIIPLFYDDYNYWAFGVFTSFLIKGQNPYHIVAQDPTLLVINVWRYPPLYLLFTGPALLVRQFTGQTLVYLAALKIPFALADVVSTFYLFKILADFLPRNTSLRVAAFFAFNPVVVFESSVGGFNDPIPIALTVASLYYFLKARGNDEFGRDLSKSSLLLGLGIATKIYPLLLVPILLRDLRGTRGRILYLLLSLVPAAVTSLPFLLWDWRSYIDLLAIRNPGGQHPLFPGLGFSGFVAVPVGAILVITLGYVYGRRMPLISRIVLVFLWVNLAVFAESFNYMVWGVPFFTLFVATHRRWFWMPLSPITTMLVALLFQGSYNQVGGSSGIFYWTYHLFQLRIVPFLGSFAHDALVFVGLLVGETLAGYYFLRVAMFKPTGETNPFRIPRITPVIPAGLRRKKLFSSLVLCLIVVVSWGAVAAYGSFLPHQYPVVEGTSFRFSDSFHTSILDYQWIFERNGSYSIDPSQGSIKIIDAPDGTAHIFRGWAGVTDGFHTSTSAAASFSFRFEAFLPGSVGMTIANMTDGQLVVYGATTPNFLYVDQLNNSPVLLSKADNSWHNFTITYRGGNRNMTIDGTKWVFPGGSFSRFILGNSDSRSGFHGSAEFSNVLIQVNDFPTGYQSQLASWFAVILPPLFVALLLSPLSQRVETAFGNLLRKSDSPQVSTG